jgi:hypothetical protein
MHNIFLLLSIVIKIIIVICLISLISILFIREGGRSHNYNNEKFTNVNPTLNKCFIYKTKIEEIIKPFEKDFINAENNIKNANADIEKAKAATDPNYDSLSLNYISNNITYLNALADIRRCYPMSDRTTIKRP